tara:strand:- start:4846 stop:6108 length:1263 start_codon:yes stop_codon:yes gene_type:complete
MPKIQLIRKDGGIIELEASQIAFQVTRGVSVWPIPIFGVRAGLDLNANTLNITVDGILRDDESVSGSTGAVAHFDLSRPTGLFSSWFTQQQDEAGSANIAAIVTALGGKQIIFKSAGQMTAALGETITLQFYATGSLSPTVATSSIVPVNISGTINNTGDIATAINTALAGGSVKVNAATTAISSIFTITQTTGNNLNSSTDQSIAALTNEKITLTNITKDSDGNTPVVKSGAIGVSVTQNWASSFYTTTAFTGGVSGTRMSKGDKIQDLINMTVNASPGGGMLSPQSFTGSLIEMPESLSSLDVSTFLRISQSDAVKKYIVGIRIPYESMITATGGANETLRQFILPSGPGTDYAAEKNTASFDPVDVIGGESVRPNPFFRQGVAIPGVVQTFNPSYEAGDSVWVYNLTFAACEQLLGI